MEADLEKLEPSLEELCEVRNLVVYHLLVIDVVIRLEVNARVSHEEESFDLD